MHPLHHRPVLLRHPVEQPHPCHPRVVHQHVHPSEILQRSFYYLLALNHTVVVSHRDAARLDDLGDHGISDLR
jgi:hypothetical protein